MDGSTLIPTDDFAAIGLQHETGLFSSVLSSSGLQEGSLGQLSGGPYKNIGPLVDLFGLRKSDKDLPLVTSSAGLLADSTYLQC